jgi:hypothetical protein
MFKFRFNLWVMCALLLSSLSGFGQTTPCQRGTLASVLGTSCSVGPVIFNFQPDSNGFFAIFNVASGPVTAADIGFIPLQQERRAGFKLVLNFSDEAASGGFHFFDFGYTPQAAPGFEIRRQGLSVDALATSIPSGFGIINAFDLQTYPNSGFVDTGIIMGSSNGVPSGNQTSDLFLKVPGFISTGASFSSLTTIISTVATPGSTDAIKSATILYAYGPVVPIPPAASLKYTSIDLTGVAATFVSNITNSGRTVGTYQDFSGVFHGYVAEPNGSFATIDVPGAIATFATGLNEQGDVTGSYDDPARQVHGFILRNGAITTFDVPQSVFTIPIAINDKEQIVGFFRTADFGLHGFLLDQGVFTTIDQGPGTAGFALTQALAINNTGTVGGDFFNPNTFRSFLQQGAESQHIDVPGQGDTVIEGINNQGDTIGIFDDISLVQHGFVRRDEGFQTVDHPDGIITLPLGINGFGKIVGQYADATGQPHSFLAEFTAVPDAHRDAAAPLQPVQRPDCRDENWQRQNSRLRNAGICQVKP